MRRGRTLAAPATCAATGPQALKAEAPHAELFRARNRSGNARNLAAVWLRAVLLPTAITGARLVNVCTAEVQDDIDVAIAEGRIAYVGQSAAHCIGESTRVNERRPGDCPGDGHIHGVIHDRRRRIRPAVMPHGTVGIYIGIPTRCATMLGLFPGCR